MAALARLATAASVLAWGLLAAATAWNAHENRALRAELALMRQQQAVRAAAMPPPAAPMAPAATPSPAPSAMPVTAPPPATKPAGAPPRSPATLEEALARWREAPDRAAVNPFGSP